MKNITLKWILDKDERPTKKGEYLTITPSGMIQEIFYDPKLGEWNCYTIEHVEENRKDDYHYEVIAWADSKEIHDEFEEKE